MSLLAYFALLMLALVTLPQDFLDRDSERFIFIVGAIGAWRYCWAITHFVRSLIYRQLVFPRMRRRAEALGQDGLAEQVYLLVTTFKISTETRRAGLPCRHRGSSSLRHPDHRGCIPRGAGRRAARALPLPAARPP